MALNYGVGDNFRIMVPTMNGTCIYSAVGGSLVGQYPNPPNHARPYIPIYFIINPDSVIHITNHTFNTALPLSSQDCTMEYYLTTVSRESGVVTDTKILEYKPKLSAGTVFYYEINEKIRVRDVVPRNLIDGASVFTFSVKRKTGSAYMGSGSNIMSYVILRP